MLTRVLSIPFLVCATACSSEGQEVGTSTDASRSNAPAAGSAIVASRVIGTIQAMSSISLIISFQPGEIGKATRLPADNGTGVFYIPSVVEGPLFGIADGRLEVSSLHAPRSGTGEVAGSFHGTMQIPPGSERTLIVTQGRFEIEALPYREELPGGGRW